ncbi:MAG: gluconate 2-dehydrogenase subunit 3 family protein [Rudaea sp.]|uniref:gluconate 2-dehydrogenase subunit 3 family protein n=1 Tax=Rudaea sp. TaxID=2136325 RepID=UPI0039E721EF
MDRREAIQRIAWLMGSAAAAPAVLGALEAWAGEPPGGDWKPAVLGAAELAVVSRIVDILLPRTDTPGALDAGVPAFIDTMLKDVSPPDARARYLKQLHEFDESARKGHGKPFLELDAQKQKAWLQQTQNAAIANERAAIVREQKALHDEVRAATTRQQRTQTSFEERPRSFIMKTKELALLGFFTSQPGATQVLQYVAIPGAFHGCLPVSEAGNGKRWAT